MSEQVEMDELAYSSRMLDWAPLGKLFLTLLLLITGLVTDCILVPVITFCIGVALMAYSTNLRIPLLLAVGIGEAIVIMIIGSGMISIMGDPNAPAIWSDQFLWYNIHMTVESFNNAWLIFVRAIAGVTLMMAFASSTPIPHLAQAIRSLRCPPELVEIIILIYRYAFLLLERFLVMLDAAQCRLGYNGSLTAIKSYGGAMANTFIFSMELAEKSEASLACRNYRGYFPVYRLPRKMTAKWFVFPVILSAVLLVFGYYAAGWVNMEAIFAPFFGW